MSRTFTVGGEQTFTVLPEAPRVRLRLQSVEQSQFNANIDRWCFLINDPEYENGDSDEVDAAIREASEDEIELYESVNLPKGPKIGKGTKLYKYLSGMAGRDIPEDEDVDLDDYIPGDYYGDIEVVDKMVRLDDGSFRPAKDEKGRTLKKNAVTKLKPIAKRKGAATKPKGKAAKVPVDDIPEDDDDLDLDEIEEEAS